MLKARWLFNNKVMEQVIMSLFYLTLQKIYWFSNSALFSNVHHSEKEIRKLCIIHCFGWLHQESIGSGSPILILCVFQKESIGFNHEMIVISHWSPKEIRGSIFYFKLARIWISHYIIFGYFEREKMSKSLSDLLKSNLQYCSWDCCEFAAPKKIILAKMKVIRNMSQDV